MGEDLDAANAGRARNIHKKALQRVARGGGGLLVGFIGEEFAFRIPGEQDRHAGEAAIGDDLRKAEARLVETGVETVHIEQHVAAVADAAGNVRGEFGAEGVRIERAPTGDDEVLFRIGRTETRRLDLACAMARRHGHVLQRKARNDLAVAVALAPRRSDEQWHLLRDAGIPPEIGAHLVADDFGAVGNGVERIGRGVAAGERGRQRAGRRETRETRSAAEPARASGIHVDQAKRPHAARPAGSGH